MFLSDCILFSLAEESSIANTDLCTKELPGVTTSAILLLIIDINILSIHLELEVAAIGALNSPFSLRDTASI